MYHLTIAYITSRQESMFEWFADSLANECVGDFSDKRLVGATEYNIFTALKGLVRYSLIVFNKVLSELVAKSLLLQNK